jgi:hypothetical protein
VTEWPASEKSRLESLLATRTVAVAYSGCDLRIVEACRLDGGYDWRQTTLSTDAVEINDADELYAKLPIGAVSLEGELSRSGRLAVETTVAGQFERTGPPLPLIERKGPCAEVTHFVSAVSIGAFKLKSGGALGARGGVDAYGAGARVDVKRSEVVLREAGAPESCVDATPDAPASACRSPIQIFLQEAKRKLTHEERLAREEEEQARLTGAVQLTLEPPPGEAAPWSLRREDEVALCELPCTRWVPPASGYEVRRDDAREDGHLAVDLPPSFPAARGERLPARVELAEGSLAGAWTTVSVSVAALVGGFALLATTDVQCINQQESQPAGLLGGCPDGFESTGETSRPVWIGPVMMGAGALGLGAGIYWVTVSHGDRIVLGRGIPGTPRVQLGPTGARGVF